MEKNNREEEFQEAIIKYTAYKYAEREGKKILQEKKEYDNLGVKNPMKKDFKQLDKIYNKESKKIKKFKIKIPIIYKIAAIIAVVLIVANISIISVPAMRNATLDFLTKVSSESTEIKLPKSEIEGKTYDVTANDDIHFGEDYSITYLPKGFAAISLTADVIGKTKDYSDGHDNMIMFSQCRDDQKLDVDSENATMKTIDINGHGAYVSIKDDTIGITWHMGNYFIDICGVGVGEDEMIKVAKSVRKK